MAPFIFTRRERPDKVAFTLIELLTVLAVIALLAAMLLPALARAKEKGRSIACVNNVKQLSLATMMYADDCGDRLPYNLGAREIVASSATNYYPNWTSPILSWELDPDNTNTVMLTHGGIGDYTSRTPAVYRCPSDIVVSDVQAGAGWTRRVRSTSMNMMVGDAGNFSRGGQNVNNPSLLQFFKSTHVPQPSRIFVFTEEHPHSINDGYFWDRADSHIWTDLPASWHNGSANLTFADGHAESHKWLNASTKPASRPDSVGLPFHIPPGEQGDFNWLLDRMSIEVQPDQYGTSTPYDPYGP
jgi:prepilin-type processing-associated H-X9-DG protein/prepilin-type N-terminal cleavage/methylation domain-containing protein